MTTPKPASAPQADAFAMQLAAWLDTEHHAGRRPTAHAIREWIRAAQVREAEPAWLTMLRAELPLSAMKSSFNMTRDELAYLVDRIAKPAAEQVPVAQGDVAEFFEREVADHARRVAELEKDVLDMADKAIDAYIQRDTAEASLAACRANEARYLWLREHFRFANDSLHEIWFDSSLEPDDAGVPGDLDAAIDSLRQEAT